MHEAAIVRSILDVAEAQARQHGAVRVSKIKLRVGEFRGVVKEALDFAFQALRPNTLASAAELEVETVRLRVECPACLEVACSIHDFSLSCPRCGGLATIVAGREMQIEYIDLDSA